MTRPASVRIRRLEAFQKLASPASLHSQPPPVNCDSMRFDSLRQIGMSVLLMQQNRAGKVGTTRTSCVDRRNWRALVSKNTQLCFLRHIGVGYETGWARCHDGDQRKLAMNEMMEPRWKFGICWYIADEETSRPYHSWLYTICKRISTGMDYGNSFALHAFINKNDFGRQSCSMTVC